MADLFQVGTTPNGSPADLTVSDVDGLGPGGGSSLGTGDLRRKYNFGDRVSELALAQDPFFRFLSKVSKKPTDDPAFKWAEKRPSWNKRYAYVMGYIGSDGADDFTNAIIEANNTGSTGDSIAVGDTLKLYMAGDYKNSGNIQNIYGNTTNKAADVGASGTQPQFFIPRQMIKIPMMTADQESGDSWGSDYTFCRITAVDTTIGAKDTGAVKYPTLVTCSVVR